MHFINLLLTSSGSAWVPLADAIAKATLLFAAAGAVSFLLRRGSAATRHMVWTLALLSALVLPVLSIALPRWQLPIVTLAPGAYAGQADESVRDAGPAPQRPAAAVITRPGIEARTERLTANTPAAPSSATAPQPIDRRSAAKLAPRRDTAGEIHATSQNPWPVIVLALWVAGAAAILGRIAAGHLAVLWMSRRNERVNDAPWLPLARALAAKLGISPRIMFLRSRTAAMPMAWGVVLPTVLMPADADTWPAERLRIVLLHELAHVKRRDCLTHLLAQIACALYWFNPLAWMAARQVRTERERACDDLVLAAGTRGSDYANQLIEVARVMRAGRFPVLLSGASLAMAHRSQLEGRLLAILDPNVPRSGAGRVRTAAAATVFACALMPLASVQPWAIAADGAASSAAPVHAAPPPDVDLAPARPSMAPAPAPRPLIGGDVTLTAGAAPAQLPSGAHQSIESSPRPAVASSVPKGTASIEANIQATIQSNIQSNIHSIIASHAASHEAVVDQHAKGTTADPRMITALTAALKDTDKGVRETALHALVRLRDPNVFAPLMQALADASPDVREQAAFGLGQMRDRRAVEPLVTALKDANADVRQQAAFALGQLRDRSAVAGLTAVLKDPDDDVREQAVFALGQIRDPAAYEGLAAAVHDAKADVRQQAVFSLGQLRDRRALEPLISALKDSAPDVREQAAFALGQIRDPRAVEALVIALKDNGADVRQQAAFALGQLRDTRAIDGLTAALKDASADVRQQAAFALGQLIR